jgi:hypothetical protein
VTPRRRRGGSPVRAAVLTATLVALAACGDQSTGPHTIAPTPVDVSALVTSATNASYNGVARSLVLLPAFVTSPINTAACPYSSKDQAFVCTPIVRNGITAKTSYQLLDSGGHPLSSADALTLASIRVVTDVDGTTSLVSTTTGTISSTTIHSHADNTLSGLLTDKRVLNGVTTERDTLSSVFSGLATQLSISATTTVAKLDIPQTAGAFPATGTITSDASTTESLGGSTPFTSNSHAVITFNGTSSVTITLAVGSFSQHCTLDLTNAAGLTCTPG